MKLHPKDSDKLLRSYYRPFIEMIKNGLSLKIAKEIVEAYDKDLPPGEFSKIVDKYKTNGDL